MIDTTMEIILEFSDEVFNATAVIIPGDEISANSFSFILNNSLTISGIYCNGKRANYEIEVIFKPDFRPFSKKILIKNDDYIHNIAITYSGTVAFSFEERSCWHNIVTRDLKSLSFYSTWYPQDTSIAINRDKVVIVNGQDYFVVKGDYNEANNTWEYGGKGYDPFNIVVYRKDKLQIISNPFVNIYFIDDNIKAQAEESVSIYREIIDFYNGNLFKQMEIPVLDIACASPVITIGGGYRRKDFMWCTTLGNDTNEITWLNAHETAHIWCAGADYGSWEDWLNETSAEWASLLFALHKNDTALFDYIINPKLEKYDSLPPIKTADGSRPDGVHDKGTVLFYEMYKLYGVDAVRKAVRLFTELEQKNTGAFIQALYDMNENEIAEFIKEGIN